ncbi:MAG: hypothetical protein K2X01_03095 [Cyanobacteria bacterium]|nr:hypothetical protein [Cyanobacteriota bacterium]
MPESELNDALQSYQQRLEQKVDQLFEDKLSKHGQSLWTQINQQLEQTEACRYAYEDASAYYDHLEPYSEVSVQAYETHLPHCPPCQGHLKSLDSLIPALHTFYSRWESQVPVDLTGPVLHSYSQVKLFPSQQQKKVVASVAVAASVALFCIVNPFQQSLQSFQSSSLTSQLTNTSKAFIANASQEKASSPVLEVRSNMLKQEMTDSVVERDNLPQAPSQLSQPSLAEKMKLKPLTSAVNSNIAAFPSSPGLPKAKNIRVVVSDNLKASPVLQAALQRLVAGTVTTESSSADERRYSLASTTGASSNPGVSVSSPSAEEYLINSNIPADNSVVMDEASYLITLP